MHFLVSRLGFDRAIGFVFQIIPRAVRARHQRPIYETRFENVTVRCLQRDHVYIYSR